jgi:xylan 1,4-beta-xylosidase
MTQYRIDQDHSNAYAAWIRMGSPAAPTDAQRTALQQAGQLQTIAEAVPTKVVDGAARIAFTLPRQGVSLVVLTW